MELDPLTSFLDKLANKVKNLEQFSLSSEGIGGSPISPPGFGGNINQTDMLLAIGTVVASDGNILKVQLPPSMLPGVIPAVCISHSSGGPLGVKEQSSLLPGTKVIVAIDTRNAAGMGYILASFPYPILHNISTRFIPLAFAPVGLYSDFVYQLSILPPKIPSEPYTQFNPGSEVLNLFGLGGVLEKLPGDLTYTTLTHNVFHLSDFLAVLGYPYAGIKVFHTGTVHIDHGSYYRRHALGQETQIPPYYTQTYTNLPPGNNYNPYSYSNIYFQRFYSRQDTPPPTIFPKEFAFCKTSGGGVTADPADEWKKANIRNLDHPAFAEHNMWQAYGLWYPYRISQTDPMLTGANIIRLEYLGLPIMGNYAYYPDPDKFFLESFNFEYAKHIGGQFTQLLTELGSVNMYHHPTSLTTSGSLRDWYTFGRPFYNTSNIWAPIQTMDPRDKRVSLTQLTQIHTAEDPQKFISVHHWVGFFTKVALRVPFLTRYFARISSNPFKNKYETPYGFWDFTSVNITPPGNFVGFMGDTFVAYNRYGAGIRFIDNNIVIDAPGGRVFTHARTRIDYISGNSIQLVGKGYEVYANDKSMIRCNGNMYVISHEDLVLATMGSRYTDTNYTIQEVIDDSHNSQQYPDGNTEVPGQKTGGVVRIISPISIKTYTEIAENWSWKTKNYAQGEYRTETCYMVMAADGEIVFRCPICIDKFYVMTNYVYFTPAYFERLEAAYINASYYNKSLTATFTVHHSETGKDCRWTSGLTACFGIKRHLDDKLPNHNSDMEWIVSADESEEKGHSEVLFSHYITFIGANKKFPIGEYIADHSGLYPSEEAEKEEYNILVSQPEIPDRWCKACEITYLQRLEHESNDTPDEAIYRDDSDEDRPKLLHVTGRGGKLKFIRSTPYSEAANKVRNNPECFDLMSILYDELSASTTTTTTTDDPSLNTRNFGAKTTTTTPDPNTTTTSTTTTTTTTCPPYLTIITTPPPTITTPPPPPCPSYPIFVPES